MADGNCPWTQLAEAVGLLDERPQLQSGVESVQQVTRRGETFHVLRNAVAGTYVKVTADEFRLLPLLDGSHTIRDIVVADYEHTGVVNVARVAGLAGQLRSQSFLAQPPRDVFAQLGTALRGRSLARLPARLGRAFVQRSFATNRADPVFGWLYRKGGWLCFTRPVALFGVLCGVLGPIFFLAEFVRGRYPLFRAGDSYLLGFVLFGALESITLLVHELGHALAAKHAHRFVPRAGVMIYYGFPAAFVDTSDVWMSPRRERLLTSFAGPWTGLVIGGIAATTAFALPQGALGGFLYAWSFVCVLNTLLNLVPFLELDGYFLFIDLVEQPMLRTRSLRFLRSGVWKRLTRHEKLSADERLFVWFGLASAGMTGLMVLMALRFWEIRTLPAIREVWETGLPPVQFTVVAMALVAVCVALAGLWNALDSVKSAAIPTRIRRATERWRRRHAISLLRSVPGLSGLQEGRLLDISAGSSWVSLESGDRFQTGDPPSLFVVRTGRLASDSGLLVAADCLGAESFWKGSSCTTATALERCEVLSLERARCASLLCAEFAAAQRLNELEPYRSILAHDGHLHGLNDAALDLVLARGELVDVWDDAVPPNSAGGLTVVLAPPDPVEDPDAPGEWKPARPPTRVFRMLAADYRDIVCRYLDRSPGPTAAPAD